MINVNFNGYANYQVDNLTQWDTNQEIRVTGLTFSGTPTVLFSNRLSIVAEPVNASYSGGVLTATIPNGLLTEAYPVYAYVRIRSGNTYTVVAKIRIPVEKATKPDDYVYIENIGIVSYSDVMAKLDEIENNEIRQAVLRNTIEEYIDARIADGSINALFIADGSIGRDKLSPDIKLDLDDGDVTTPKIADEAVTPEKTSFLKSLSEKNDGNLLNGITYTDGKWLNENDNLTSSAVDYVTDYIPVKENTRYLFNPEALPITNASRSISFYSRYKHFIRNFCTTSHEFITDKHVAYIRVATRIAYRDVEYLHEAGEGVNDYKIPGLKVDGNDIADGSIDLRKLSITKKVCVDLFDNEKNRTSVELGYFNSSGDNVGNSVVKMDMGFRDVISDYIPVKPGQILVRNPRARFSCNGQYTPFYDVDKNKIAVIFNPIGSYTIQVPENAYFMRTTIWFDDIDTIDFLVDINDYDPDETAYTDPNINLLANISYTEKQIVDNNGEIATVASAENRCTDYIPVVPGTKYYRSISGTFLNNIHNVAEYDADKNHIGTITTKIYPTAPYSLDGSFTVSENTHYIRMTLSKKYYVTEFLVSEDNLSKIRDLKSRYTRYETEGLTSTPGSDGAVSDTLPRLDLYGDPSKMTASKNEVPFRYKYTDKDDEEIRYGYAMVKWQGNSSLSYPKKNYTIKFYNDAKFKSKDKHDAGFGYISSKYVAKANWIDHSHARNIVSARLWSRIVKSRSKVPAGLVASPNYGAVDGYFIEIYINDEYNGLYTLNIPKDDVTYGLDEDNPLHCAVSGMYNNDGNTSKKTGADFRLNDLTSVSGLTGWENEVPEVWNTDTKTGLFNLIKFVNESTDAEFRANLDKYLDVESVIDYYLFAYFILASDSLGKNIILVTYDAVKWYMSAYDLDSTFGIHYTGSSFYDPETKCPEQYQETNSLLFQRIEKCFARELKERYDELRSSILSVENVHREFTRFMGGISQNRYASDYAKWPTTPSGSVNHLSQIKSFISDRSVYVDGEISDMLVPCTSLTIGSATATVSVEGTVTLSATKNSATTDMIDWSTADKAIATVDYNGVVTGVAPGTVVITAKCGEKTATCEITVS